MKSDTPQDKERFTVAVSGHGSFEVASGLNLREGLREQGLFIDGSCGDKGTCGRCVVGVISGGPEGTGGAPGPSERGILGPAGIASGERLACRVVVTGDLVVRIDDERILEIDRTGRWKEVGGSPLAQYGGLALDGAGYGITLDLGTTSIAAALYDLATGRLLDTRAAANPQLPWGEEILSRLQAASGDKAVAASLRDELWRAARDLVRSLLRRSAVSSGRVTRIVAVANSAIHHLALGLDPAPLLAPPFQPSRGEGLSLPAGDGPFELPAGRGTVIEFLPLVGGYAGSDCLAAVLAARHAAARGDGAGAVVDVGTNTEIGVWRGDRVMVATAPAGPAFEGGHIRFGMKAEEGAIYSVELGEQEVAFRVIGDGSPRGLCGTGIVDAVAGMVARNVVDGTGMVLPGSHPAINADNALVLDEASGVLLEPGDIATVQKAKAAIAATMLSVLDAMEMKPEGLSNIYLAGAFGSRLDVPAAVRIGLLPQLPPQRYVLAGNAAMAGAGRVLLSREGGREAQALARTIVHLDVAASTAFQELFLENLYFG